MKKALSVYTIVFGIVAAIILIAAISTFAFNQNLSAKNVSLSSLKNYGTAPNFVGISNWINSPALNISRLRGKVVLVDFWTYSCINCIRTIPYLNSLENKYGNNGLVIVGVHSPEFDFEKNYTNVLNAVQRYNIKYAVALDSDHSTWNAYQNEYWPADYLIDKNGNIRYEQFGEGDYNQTEKVIQELLQNAGYNASQGLINPNVTVNFSQIGTPEIYLGYNTARAPIGNSNGFSPNNITQYSAVNVTNINEVYFSGSWYNAPDGMVAINNSKLFLWYKAKNVNVVASENSAILVRLDGKALSGSYFGSDATLINGNAIVKTNQSRLYDIISAPSYGAHLLEIDASPNFKIYTFTFG